MMRARILGAAGLILMATTGCSTLKTASLRDASVLPAGGEEFSFEASGTEHMPKTVALLARDDEPAIGRIADSLGYTGADLRDHEDGFLWGFSYARGFGGGWEAHGGLNLPILRGGPWLGDLGLKKRLSTGGKFLLSGYGRIGLGASEGDFTVFDRQGSTQDGEYHADAVSAEADLAMIGQWRRSQNVSFYFNIGPSAAAVRWSLEDGAPSPAPYREGTVTTFGLKNRFGFVVEFQHYEVLAELGLAIYDRGLVPSIGIRQAWKADWKQ